MLIKSNIKSIYGFFLFAMIDEVSSSYKLHVSQYSHGKLCKLWAWGQFAEVVWIKHYGDWNSLVSWTVSSLSKVELLAFSARLFLFKCFAAGHFAFTFVNVALGEVLSSVIFMIWEVEISLGRSNSLHFINLASPILYSCHTLMPSIVAVWNVVNETNTIAFKRLWPWHCGRITYIALPSHPGYHCLILWFSSFGWKFQRHFPSSGILWHGSWLWLLFGDMTLFHLGGLKNLF